MPRAVPKVYISNLVAIANEAQDRLDALSRLVDLSPASVAGLAERARDTLKQVTALCEAQGSLPAGLPAPSQRAFQWLNYLAEPAQAFEAAAALARARGMAEAQPRRPGLARAAVRLLFYPSPYLFRMVTKRLEARLTIAPGFMSAPDDVLAALLRGALGDDDGGARHVFQTYANDDDFAEFTLALEMATEPPPGSARGAHYDLDQVFDRVNRAYFGGQLPRPRLAWSAAAAQRRMGFYQRSTDRLILSPSLDAPRVPACAIDFVMYHELLHKKLGVQVVNGRAYSHTEAFRLEERKFREYEEAVKYLRGG